MSMALHTAYVGAGSNIGDRMDYLAKAYRKLLDTPGIEDVKASPVYISEPLGVTTQELFTNMVFMLRTTLSPRELLMACKETETALGRPEQHERWGPRVIDLDILFFDTLQLSTPELVIPHPELHKRKFVLLPLLDLADPYHPVLDKSSRKLLEACPDNSRVIKQKGATGAPF